MPITLGDLIVLLKHRPDDDEVRFDFGGFIPRGAASYRGYYEQLAIGYDDNWRQPRVVAELRAHLEDCLGRTFTGYKGGDYDMHQNTPVWAANIGECHSTAITGIADCRYMTVLKTEFCDL